MNSEAVHASPRKTGMIILGGGLPKHHICNANMMRNGADYAVFINTGQEFDGSDSGARPDEAVSWGKIRGSAKTVKVCLCVPCYLSTSVIFFLDKCSNFIHPISRNSCYQSTIQPFTSIKTRMRKSPRTI